MLTARSGLVCVSLFVYIQCHNAMDSMRAINLAKKWAPKIWLHDEETCFPYNAEDFLKQMDIFKIENPDSDARRETKVNYLPQLKDSWPYFLKTKKDKNTLLRDRSSFLYGTDPTQNSVPIYAFLRWCNPSTNTFFIDYWFFFSFNEGKALSNVLGVPVPEVFQHFTGPKKLFGSHVGDWEQVILEFKNWQPGRLHLSVHSVGVDYDYDKASGRFINPVAGEKGMTVISDPGPSVELTTDGHPVIYMAQGSHSIWSSPGDHSYTWVPSNQMRDRTTRGVPWDTWHSVQVFTQDTAPSWWWYFGKWGNLKSDCKPFCLFTDGPPGLGGRTPKLECPPARS